MRPLPAWLVGCVLTQTLLLTSCTWDDDPASEPTAAPTSTRHSTDAETEKKLTKEVQSALDSVTDQGSSMVESGIERVSEGVHTQPGLTEGATYKVSVVCAGEGAAEIVFTPTAAASKKPVPCDGTLVFQRFVAKGSLHIDVKGKRGAAGMIAWRIDEM